GNAAPVAGAAGGAGTAAAAGAAAAKAAAPAATYAALPCAATVIRVNGMPYWRCGATWLTQAYISGSVMYVATAAPPGY
ncbi:hypothetical protein QU487_19800, partial [Crenobacter sp. SG2305]|uniref:hypothetical protein n=1 Tax=Crenobacter oryzisoli TaxID=3056844 RepID=UPI0025AADE1F